MIMIMILVQCMIQVYTTSPLRTGNGETFSSTILRSSLYRSGNVGGIASEVDSPALEGMAGGIARGR